MNRNSLGAAVLGVTLMVWPALAFAHAHIKKSFPKQNQVLSQPVRAVTLTFTEDVEPRFSKIEVTQGATGVRVDQGKLQPQGKNTLTIGLKEPLSAGKYHVAWKATAVDTHKSHGEYEFTYAPKH